MRRDGRMFDEMRPVKISKNYLKFAKGSTLIEIGNTKVICSATIEEKVPFFLKDTGEGWITAEYGMLPQSTTERIVRERIKVSGRTYEIQRLIGRSLRAVVNLKNLGERTIWLDCDVLQADGGTRTAAITGSFIALIDALNNFKKVRKVREPLIYNFVGAVSVGIVEGKPLLDLSYEEDSKASVDMNVVMTGGGRFVEIQGSGEETSFSKEDLNNLLALAKKGIKELIKLQKEMLGEQAV